MGLAMGMFVKFWVATESTIPIKLLNVCQNIVLFTMENLDEFLESGVVLKIINCPIITHVVKEIDYTKDKLSEVQKMLLEVYLPLITLKNLVEEKTGSAIDSIL